MVLGKPDKNRQDTSVTKVVRPSLKKGDLALVYLAKYAGEWPQMGRIVEVLKDEKCTLHWHKGSMTGSWSQCSIPVRGEKGKRVPWIEEIPISSVWFYGFSLTPAGKLNQKTKDQISNFSDF